MASNGKELLGERYERDHLTGGAVAGRSGEGRSKKSWRE